MTSAGGLQSVDLARTLSFAPNRYPLTHFEHFWFTLDLCYHFWLSAPFCESVWQHEDRSCVTVYQGVYCYTLELSVLICFSYTLSTSSTANWCVKLWSVCTSVNIHSLWGTGSIAAAYEPTTFWLHFLQWEAPLYKPGKPLTSNLVCIVPVAYEIPVIRWFAAIHALNGIII